MKQNLNTFRKSVLATAISSSLGMASATIPGLAYGDIYVWGDIDDAKLAAEDTTICDTSATGENVVFTMLDSSGAALANSSIPAKGNNQYQTPTCGTLTYDTSDDTGSMQIGAFDFFSNPATLPAVAQSITLRKVDDGSGNDVLLANMLFNWNGNNGIPVSLVYNADELLDQMDGTPDSSVFTLSSDGSINTAAALTASNPASGNSAVIPASDGTYVGAAVPGTVNGPGGFPGYLGLGPTPVATTAWNTTNTPACGASCLGVNPSGTDPLIEDVAPNGNDYVANIGGTIGGSPMQDGPFSDNNANFDFKSLTLVSFVDETPPVITLNAHVTPAGTTPLTLTVGTDTYSEPGASCTDAAPLNTNLDGDVVVGGDSPATINAGTAGQSFTVTYDCQDPSNIDAVQVSRTINWVGAGSPAIMLSGSDPATHECAVTYSDAGASCSDPEDGNIPVGATAPQDFSLDDSSNLDVNSLAGGQFVTWSCTDNDSNTTPLDRSVTVVDTTDPVVTPSGGATINVVSSTTENMQIFTDPGATVTDTCNTGITSPITASSGSVNMVVPSTGAATRPYVLQYSATDASGNTGTAQSTVNVTRSQPVITLAGSGSVTVSVGGTYTEPGFTIVDAQDGNVTTPVTTSGPCGTGMTCTINSNVNTAVEGNYTVTYEVQDSDGNLASTALGGDLSTITRTVNVGAFAVNSNFTMLDGSGNVFGGTNDVTFTWDGSMLSDPSTDLTSNMTIATSTPTPFFSFVWDAHDVRVFGPGQYWFDTRCTAAQLRTQGSCSTMTDPGDPVNWIHMTVPAGFVGAHMLFDWNTTDDIDVVNVWDDSGTGVWADADGQVDTTDSSGTATPKNDLHVIDNPPGIDAPDPTTTWALVSIDHNGDGVNGSPMIDGPFKGSYANFNADPADRLTPITEVKAAAPDTKLDGLSSMSLAGLLAGMLAFFGRRFSRKH